VSPSPEGFASPTTPSGVKSRLDLKVRDLGPVPLRNIAEPMRVYSLEVGAPPEARSRPPADQPKQRASKRRWVSAPLAALAGLLILVAASGWYMLGGRLTKPAQAAHLSVVVLPFTNLSGDPSQDYFADGVTENLTTDLSRIRHSFVIARNTAFTFKGKNLDAKAIGKELGVRYVLEGSVQRDANRVRVNAQLIDAESGAHLWADRFEENVADLFKLQDQVVARLANALGYELVKAESEAGAHSKNPDAIDLTMRGRAAMFQWAQQQPTKEGLVAVRAWFDRALEIDPNDADALAGEANTYMAEYAYGWTNPETDYDAKILGQADRSIALAPDNMNAYGAKSLYLNISLRPNDALRVADAGLAVDPNYAYLYGVRSTAETYLRQFEQARSDVEQAMRLSPRDPRMDQFHNFMADAELGLGHVDTAIDEANKAIDAGYRNWYSYLNLAAAHALKDDIDQAKAPSPKLAASIPSSASNGWSGANLFCSLRSTDFVRRGCRRSEASLKAACESGCDAHHLSTGRSIRVWRRLCWRRMPRAMRGPVWLRGPAWSPRPVWR
jgi:adenylate cyclase